MIAARPAAAQTYYGIIRGTVLDSGGAIVPNGEITVLNLDTNVAQTFLSNEVGNFVAPNLIPGTYRVSAEAAGFKKFVADAIQLVATADRRVDIRLEIGDVTESVTVEGGAQLIETERATISDVKSNTSAFVVPVAGMGRFGNSGVYILEAPGINVSSLAWSRKSFSTSVRE